MVLRTPVNGRGAQGLGRSKWLQMGFVRHGKGVQIWPDGARYEGDWTDDKVSSVESFGAWIHVAGVWSGQIRAR